MTDQQIDLLSRFCAAYGYRLKQPFSRGEYTYATDGKAMIRVFRRPEVPEIPEAPHAERAWPAAIATEFRPASYLWLSEPAYTACEDCDGRGTEHDCPACHCTCRKCNGRGEIAEETAIEIGPSAIPTKYARLLVSLPGLLIAEPAETDAVLQFRFDGGEGIIAPLRPYHDLPVVGKI